MVDNDFDYIESFQLNTNDVMWEMEQELNGDLAILPVSGVAGVIPKIENIENDFAKVLTDWQEHIGCMQDSDIEDIDIVNLDMGLQITSQLTDNVYEAKMKSAETVTNSFIKNEEPLKHSNNIKYNSVQYKINCYEPPVSNSDHNEKEIALEAGDVKSLFEQFEATEALSPSHILNGNSETNTSDLSIKKSQITILKNFINSQDIVLRKETCNSLKKKKLNRVKITNNSFYSNRSIDKSIQLDHDYCSNSNLPFSNDSMNYNKSFKFNNEYIKTSKVRTIWMDSSSKKDNHLKSVKINNANKKQALIHKPTKRVLQGMTSKESKKMHSTLSQLSFLDKNIIFDKARIVTTEPVYETNIQSPMATHILKLRKGIFANTKSMDIFKSMQMVSVLKKPLISTKTENTLINNMKKSIITTTNNINDKLRNIIIEDVTDVQKLSENIKKKTCRQLNLKESRIHLEQNCNNGYINCSIQPMILTYIHHVSTNTESVKNSLDNFVSFNREIVSVLKSKSEIENQKLKPKRFISDKSIQTVKTVFKISFEDNDLKKPINKYELDQQKKKKTKNESSGDEINVHGAVRIKKKFSVKTVNQREKINKRENKNYRSTNKTLKDDIEILQINFPNNGQKTTQTCSVDSRTDVLSSSIDSHHKIWHNKLDQNFTNPTSIDQKCNENRGRNRSICSCTCKSRGKTKPCMVCHTRLRRNSHKRSSIISSRSYSSHSRSRSRSHSRSSIKYSFLFRSRSRSSSSTSRLKSSRPRSSRYSSCSRSSLSSYRHSYYERCIEDKQCQIEERRVIYVGRLEEGITKTDLRKRFEYFGPVINISTHFRERGHNYGFVTFAYKNDAYEAVEHGNDDPSLPTYDLCFGGRREFCKVKYADLDGGSSNSLEGSKDSIFKPKENTFDLLLKEAQAKLHKRKV